MMERNSGLIESLKTKRIVQRITAAFILPLIIIYNKVSSTLLLNLSFFWHINKGIEEIIKDYVNQEIMSGSLMVYLSLYLIIVIKDVFIKLTWMNFNRRLLKTIES